MLSFLLFTVTLYIVFCLAWRVAKQKLLLSIKLALAVILGVPIYVLAWAGRTADRWLGGG